MRVGNPFRCLMDLKSIGTSLSIPLTPSRVDACWLGRLAPSHSGRLPSITPAPWRPKIMRDSLPPFQAYSVDAPIETSTGGALV